MNQTPDVKKRTHLDFRAMAILTILCATWGVQQVAIKVASQGISPFFQAGMRSALACICVWFWMVVIRKEKMFERDGTLWWGILSGVLFSLEFMMLYWGLEFTNASRSVIFLYTTPFIVAIGAHLFVFGEHIRKIQGIGLCCAFLGIIIAFSESLTLPSYTMLIGDSMAIMAAVFWGTTTIVIKASPLIRVSSSKILLYQLAFSTIFLFLGAWVKGETGIFNMTPLIGVSMAYQSFWVAFVTYLIWFWLIGRYPAANLSSFTFLTPIFGVLAGGFFLGEEITVMLLFSLLLVGSGIYLVNRSPSS